MKTNPPKGRHSAGKAVAVKEEKLPAVAYDYGDYAGAGFENTSREDFAQPFLYILQSNSPIVEQGLNDAARPGVLMNTVTQELFPADEAKQAEGIAFVPCHRDRVFVEWKPNRGGFVAQHAVDSPVVMKAQQGGKFGKLATPEGNELVETFYIYGLHVRDEATFEPVVLAFTSTKIRVYKALLTKMNMLRVGGKQVPIFANKLRVRTRREENDSGAYFNFTIGFDGGSAAEAAIDPSSQLFAEAVGFYEICSTGAVKPKYDSVDSSGTMERGTVIDATATDVPF